MKIPGSIRSDIGSLWLHSLFMVKIIGFYTRSLLLEHCKENQEFRSPVQSTVLLYLFFLSPVRLEKQLNLHFFVCVHKCVQC